MKTIAVLLATVVLSGCVSGAAPVKVAPSEPVASVERLGSSIVNNPGTGLPAQLNGIVRQVYLAADRDFNRVYTNGESRIMLVISLTVPLSADALSSYTLYAGEDYLAHSFNQTLGVQPNPLVGVIGARETYRVEAISGPLPGTNYTSQVLRWVETEIL